jgi:hypothetical protein
MPNPIANPIVSQVRYKIFYTKKVARNMYVH